MASNNQNGMIAIATYYYQIQTFDTHNNYDLQTYQLPAFRSFQWITDMKNYICFWHNGTTEIKLQAFNLTSVSSLWSNSFVISNSQSSLFSNDSNYIQELGLITVTLGSSQGLTFISIAENTGEIIHHVFFPEI